MISRKIRADEHARGRLFTGRGVYLLLILLGVAEGVWADASERRPILFFGTQVEVSRAQFALRERHSKTRQIRVRGPGQVDPADWVLAEAWPPDPGVTPADLAPLRQVEALLAQARRSAAELDEGAALRSLAQAQRLAWDALSVPGAAAFCAEVELQLAVTAAQAGRWELAADSLARAARLDRPRRLLAAEASPEVVALADRVFRDAAAGAEGELPIRVDAPRARIFVDDIDRGLAPQRVRVRAGTHALRIEAPGRLPYHARIEVTQGVRPEQQFVLAPDPRALAKTVVRDALGADATTIAYATSALLSAAPEIGAVVWIERDPRFTRELVHACDASGCRAPVRLEHGQPTDDPAGVRLTPETLREARDWMRGESVLGIGRAKASDTPWWSRWYVWTALAALVIGGGAAAAAALEPEPTRTLRVVVDSGDLR
jgi:hypothetical protein